MRTGPDTGGTRARLLTLLCRGDRTTAELASDLGMSATGVRGHLALLEEDGLVTYRVVRQGVGKPAHEYRLTAEGSLRLSRAYLPLLSTLLTLVSERAGNVETEALLREAGRRLGGVRADPDGTLADRAASAVALLEQLGAICEVKAEHGRVWIQGECCPLRALVPDHPLACSAVAAMLEEHIGESVTERCEKGDPPACRIFIDDGVAGSAGAAD